MFLLSILIPTYNRSKELENNLNILTQIIIEADYVNSVSIIISNNCSPDNTKTVIQNFIEKNDKVTIQYFEQNVNIGLEENALYVLAKAKSEYIMYLGDDDYICIEYLRNVIKLLTDFPKLHSIYPSFQSITPEGKKLPVSRGIDQSSKYYKKGFLNCSKNAWLAHQLSGLVFKRKGLYESYRTRGVSNIYPFIYFALYSCLHGDSYHLTSYPVQVTQPGQRNKDWGYGEDGLLNEVLDNYRKLKTNYFYKSLLQYRFFNKQSWRLWSYRKFGKKALLNCYLKIIKGKNGTFLFKILFTLRATITYTKLSLINKK